MVPKSGKSVCEIDCVCLAPHWCGWPKLDLTWNIDSSGCSYHEWFPPDVIVNQLVTGFQTYQVVLTNGLRQDTDSMAGTCRLTFTSKGSHKQGAKFRYYTFSPKSANVNRTQRLALWTPGCCNSSTTPASASYLNYTNVNYPLIFLRKLPSAPALSMVLQTTTISLGYEDVCSSTAFSMQIFFVLFADHGYCLKSKLRNRMYCLFYHWIYAQLPWYWAVSSTNEKYF